MKFLVIGGEQRDDAVWRNEWQHYQQGLILKVDWETGEVERFLEYKTPRELRATDESNILFKAGSLIDDRLYLCTQTEVLIYSYPDMKLIKHLSVPEFNDLHHVTAHNDELIVVSTGLDMILRFDSDYNIIDRVNVLGKDEWHRFSPEIDYRKVETTKPHESHPNFAFYIGDDLWVTRFEQRDAICLNDPSMRIDISDERVHDGIVNRDKVYITSVNGKVHVADAGSSVVTDIYDMNPAYDAGQPLGWCRGLHVEEDRLFIGFTSLRSTRFRENLKWIKMGFSKSKDEMRALPTRVVEYDMDKEKIIRDMDLSRYSMTAIFSIIRCD